MRGLSDDAELLHRRLEHRALRANREQIRASGRLSRVATGDAS